MKKVIKLTESDLTKIVNKVLKEQTKYPSFVKDTKPTSDYLGKGGQFERGLSKYKKPENFTYFDCLPAGVQAFANYVVKNSEKLTKDLGVDKNTLLVMAKAAMGIIGRETSFGEGTDFKDDAVEYLTNLGLGFIPQGLQTGYNTIKGLAGGSKQQMSLGAAQFTRDTWNTYGLDKKIGPYDQNFSALKQGLGTIYRINSDYQKALQTGNGQGPSVNPIAVRQGKIKSINGTGNNALDLAIVSHNMPGLIKKWCQTNDPNYAGPCDQQIFLPFPESKKDFKLTVYQDKPIVNYFPNKGSGKLTSIGYLEEVAKYINKFECLRF